MKPMASDFDAQDAAVCVVDKINYFKRNLAAQSYKNGMFTTELGNHTDLLSKKWNLRVAINHDIYIYTHM